MNKVFAVDFLAWLRQKKSASSKALYIQVSGKKHQAGRSTRLQITGNRDKVVCPLEGLVACFIDFADKMIVSKTPFQLDLIVEKTLMSKFGGTADKNGIQIRIVKNSL